MRGMVVFVVAVAASASFPASAQLSYTLLDLGVLTGTDAAVAGISSGGSVAITNPVAGRVRGYLWSSGTQSSIGTLGGLETQPRDINFNTALGAPQIVGMSTTASGSARAFLWTQGGTNGVVGNREMRDLGTLPNGDYSEAFGVNASGRVTGYSANAAGTDRAFIWNSGTMTDLGALVASGISKPWSYGYSINGSGQVVGVAYDASFVNSFAWFYNGSSVRNLGSLGGGNAEAVGVNDSGQIVGFSTNRSGYDRAFLTTGSTPMQDLGTLGGNSSFATGINNNGVVVGGSFLDAAEVNYRGFVYQSGTMRNLNALVDASGTGWTLEEASAINDLGQIVGVATFGVTSRAFLLSPALVWSVSGTQTGGSGTWSSSASNWLSGTARGGWAAASKAVFSGSGGTVTITGSVAVGGGLELLGNGFTIAGGTLSIAAGPAAVTRTIMVDNLATATLATTLTGTAGIEKSGSGTLIIRGANPLSGTTTVLMGTLRLGANTALTSSKVAVAGNAVLKVGALFQPTVAGLTLAATGRVDVNDGMLTVTNGLSPTTLVAKLIEGRDNGSWAGASGISSSLVATEVAQGMMRAVGWLDNGDGSVTFGYAAPGDTNLDRVVDVLDVANMLTGGMFNSGRWATWEQGDFNYDGLVDVIDAADFLTGNLYNAGPYALTLAAAPAAIGSVGSLAVVPEPTGIAGTAGALVWLAGRRFFSRFRRRGSFGAPERA